MSGSTDTGRVSVTFNYDNGRKSEHAYNVRRRDRNRAVESGFPVSRAFSSATEATEYLDNVKLTCLLCGKPCASLCRHLPLIHGISADEYKVRFNLPLGRGLIGTALRERLSVGAAQRMEDGISTPLSPAAMHAGGQSRISAFMRMKHRARLAADVTTFRAAPAECVACGEPFSPRWRTHRKFCSVKCRTRFHNQQRKASAPKTHCKQGHEFTDENTRARGGARVCRECERAAGRAWYRRNAQRRNARLRAQRREAA